MKKVEFLLEIDSNALFETLHYYQWLKKEDKKDIHRLTTKIEYLESLGFKKDENFISETTLNSLKHIEDAYFYFEIRPTLPKINIEQ